MKKDWDRRAQHHARYWIATEDYRDDDAFELAGRRTANAIRQILAPMDTGSWKALDIGCGIGRVLRPLAPDFGELVGVDVSSAMIDESKRWLSGVDNVRTFVNSGVDLGTFDDQSFDLVYSYIAFQHMPRPVFRRYLAESRRVLKPTGYLAFQLYVGSNQDPPLGDTISLRVYEEEELSRVVAKAGFRLTKRHEEHRPTTGLTSCLFLARCDESTSESENAAWIEEDCTIDRSPMDEHLYQNLATDYARAGDREMAVSTLEELIRFDSRNVDAWLELAAMFVEDGAHDRAIDVLQAALAQHTGEAAIRSSLIQLLEIAGRHADAARVRLRADESLR